MPIINRPASTKQPAQEAASPAPGLVSADSVEPTPKPASPVGIGSNLVPWAILALILGMVTTVGGYYGYASLTQTKGSEQSASEAADIAIDIERYSKVSSLASLSEQEYQANFVALQEAQKVENTQTYAALEIIVNKNRQDLAKHKEKLIEILLDMSEIAVKQPDSVMAQFNRAIAEAEQRDSVESVRLLKLGRKIMEGTPVEGDRSGYLEKALADSL